MSSPHEPDRRPIAARGWRLSQRLAEKCVAWRFSANGISLAGMVCGLLAGAAFAATPHLAAHGLERLAFVLAAALIQLRLLANMLDGMVALASGQASPVGELYNEIPDRVSDAATLIGAGYALGGDIELGYLAACGALFTAYVRAAGKAAGASNDFRGPMAKQQRMFLMTVAALYVALTPAAWQPLVCPTRGWGVIALALLLSAILGLATAVRRLIGIAGQLKRSRSSSNREA
ncbi:MAG: CDP-alcohol phosphatidyltransferase family protein [Gemmataceae bacterium]